MICDLLPLEPTREQQAARGARLVPISFLFADFGGFFLGESRSSPETQALHG
jgi:hypothetical protein